MRILYVGEIVGKAGVYALKHALPALRKERRIDFVIACADGTTGGYGLGRNHAGYLRKLGAEVLTLGECCFYKKDLVENLNRLPYVLRPANLGPEAPGWGTRVFTVGARKVAVAVLLGQSGYDRMHADNPYAALPELLERLHRETPFVVVDFHASATAEKLGLLRLADGHCSALVGSHTRVQSADERVTHQGTAYITDAGRTGSQNSVGGTDAASRIAEYRSGIPDWTRDAWEAPELQGLLIDLHENGKAAAVERLRVACPEVPSERESQGDEDSGEAHNP